MFKLNVFESSSQESLLSLSVAVSARAAATNSCNTGKEAHELANELFPLSESLFVSAVDLNLGSSELPFHLSGFRVKLDHSIDNIDRIVWSQSYERGVR